MLYSRECENELMEKLEMYGCDSKDILEHFLCWLDSDTTCKVLEDYCIDNDIPLQ